MKLKLVKKLIAFLCAILALTMLLPAALAADAPVTVSLSPVSGQKGGTVTVDVKISDKSNVGNASMTVNYDPVNANLSPPRAVTSAAWPPSALPKVRTARKFPARYPSPSS